MAAPGPLHPSDAGTRRRVAASRDAVPHDGLVLGDGRMSHPYEGKPRPRHHRAKSLYPTFWPRRCWRTHRGPEPAVALTSANLPEPRSLPAALAGRLRAPDGYCSV